MATNSSVCVHQRSKLTEWKWHSEAMMYKSKPELRNSNGNNNYQLQAGVYDKPWMKRHESANIADAS